MTLPKTHAVEFEQYKEFTIRPFKANYDAALELVLFPSGARDFHNYAEVFTTTDLETPAKII